MREIPLHAPHTEAVVAVALVDDEDYELQAPFRWRLHIGGYAVRYRPASERRGTATPQNCNALMHREIVGLPAGGEWNRSATLVVDHLNGDRLDNRRANLAIITHAENIARGQRRRRARERAARCTP